MTVALSLSLLGSFEARLAGKPLDSFRTHKVQALLIYLAVEQTAHRRESLLELLWPGMPERSARSNLRQTIYYLRQVIPDLPPKNGADADATVPILIANRQTIQLNPAADMEADSEQFVQLIKRIYSHDHLDLFSCKNCQKDLEDAIPLYRGDFLSDFYLDDSNTFEDWASAKQSLYKRKVLDVLENLTTIHLRQGEFPQAQGYAERQLDIDNLSENATRQLMEILALSGRR